MRRAAVAVFIVSVILGLLYMYYAFPDMIGYRERLFMDVELTKDLVLKWNIETRDLLPLDVWVFENKPLPFAFLDLDGLYAKITQPKGSLKLKTPRDIVVLICPSNKQRYYYVGWVVLKPGEHCTVKIIDEVNPVLSIIIPLCLGCMIGAGFVAFFEEDEFGTSLLVTGWLVSLVGYAVGISCVSWLQDGVPTLSVSQLAFPIAFGIGSIFSLMLALIYIFYTG